MELGSLQAHQEAGTHLEMPKKRSSPHSRSSTPNFLMTTTARPTSPMSESGQGENASNTIFMSVEPRSHVELRSLGVASSTAASASSTSLSSASSGAESSSTRNNDSNNNAINLNNANTSQATTSPDQTKANSPEENANGSSSEGSPSPTRPPHQSRFLNSFRYITPPMPQPPTEEELFEKIERERYEKARQCRKTRRFL